ncbi:(d)CMP kinase [Roseiconus lacunae]|uniref:Cytidylate kinase n=1 Tax=Roseiconus lacunae TaxID=2605694 RepID=A0ABT7PP80_9BACT|nr:(d)CMP kinase [Roseiconus lacunae]MCD0463328.1 (d)CMP kinase [Roseiconus lacunae]MDM4017956.1 (d)CMP kinase [Roseiconus lacunae]WRQ52470.1 (d)CMP kinase [Stieleria sp. HD01]
MIVTIDGPAGAGKSSIAHQVASRLGFEFLDTGALYRAATLAAMRDSINLDDAERLASFVGTIAITWRDKAVWIDDENVSEQIRTPEVTQSIRHLADVPAVRAELSQLQRQIAAGRNIVTEGRDQGAEVFPDAECKVFLTASPLERAKRRMRQLAESGRYLSVEDVLAAQNQRDLEDRLRDVGRLRAADDAVVVNTDGMLPEQVLDTIVNLAKERMGDNKNA